MSDAPRPSPFTSPSDKALSALYGRDEAALDAARSRYRRVGERFMELFPGHDRPLFFSSPGRSELIGNHTDHQNGKVMCAAVGMDIVCAAAPRRDGIIRLKSKGFDKTDHIDLSALDPRAEEREHSAALIRGIAARFSQLGLGIGGFDAYTESEVRTGSGLSSSAAFEILVATVLDQLYNGGRLSGLERAQISRYAENVYFGKPSGLMDQCGCGIGGFIYIDFKDQSAPRVKQLHPDFAAAGYDLVISHPGGNHADLTEAYAAIPREMRAVAAALGKEVLSELAEEDFFAALPDLRGRLSDRALLRAMHFFGEQGRVEQACAALEKGDIPAFLQRLRASGLSSWMQLQNVAPPQGGAQQPLCLALSLSERFLGARGVCRVHGGGFAGTIQAFVPRDLTAAYLRLMDGAFGAGAACRMGLRPHGGVALSQLE